MYVQERNNNLSVMDFSKDSDGDNFLALPLHNPLKQQITLVPDGTTTLQVANTVTARNKNKMDWDEPFAIGDLGILLKQYKRWKKELPRVEVYYAVKANALRPVINTMAALGCGFDCASKAEISLLLNCGVKPKKIIYAHTCKMFSHLAYARDNDVTKMTFDNEEELLKMKKVFPTARLVLRIKTDDSSARLAFGNKFGASLEYSKHLIQKARDLDLDVIGISFHVGSGCPDLESFTKAIKDSRMLFDFAREIGFTFKLLDIGGGFPGTEEANSVVSFESMAAVIRNALSIYFPTECGVTIIAEPGRYFPGISFGMVSNITSKKVMQDRISYHIGDCIYNSFYLVLIEGMKLHPVPLHPMGDKSHPTTVYGVTCSGQDIVTKDVLMQEAKVGDWLYWKDSGGYAAMVRFGFNGYSMYKACYFISKTDWKELQNLSVYPSLLPETKDSI